MAGYGFPLGDDGTCRMQFFLYASPLCSFTLHSTPIVPARPSIPIALVLTLIIRNYLILHPLYVNPSLYNKIITCSPLPLLGELLKAPIIRLPVSI